VTDTTIPSGPADSVDVPPEPSDPRPWRERIADYIGPLDRRQVALLLLVIVVSVTLRLLTWDAIADGAQGRFVKVTLFAAASSAVVWFLIRLQTAAGSWIPLVCAAVVLLAGDAIHYTRRVHPIARGAPVVSVDLPFTDEVTVRRVWDVELGEGQARFEPGAIVLQSPSGAAAYLSARIPRVPDIGTEWWLPAGLADHERAERLSWRAAVSRSGGFYVVLEAPRLLIQAVPYGLHITYPDERDQLRGHEIQLPAINDGRVHEWVLTRSSRQISLSFDGREIWTAPQRGELNQMRLGETKRDALHGGTMRIEAASYGLTLERKS
jgi:hypothetical protein